MLEVFKKERASAGSPPLVVHTRYLANLASANPLVRDRSTDVIRFEYLMAANCEADFVVLHMGSNPDRERGLALMRDHLNASLAGVAGEKPLLLLENTAGERNDLGADISEIAEFRKGLHFPTGVCLDTCHAFQAGYDFRTPDTLADFAKALSSAFEPGAIRVVHLNDSLNPFAAHHDRHENLDLGHIGSGPLARFLSLPLFKGITVILETPKAGDEDATDDLRNLHRLKSAFKGILKLTRKGRPG